jgi:hypothetical protein
MAERAIKKYKEEFPPAELSVVNEVQTKSNDDFSRASHFGWALLPMWVGVTYLFLKDMGRISEITVSSVSAIPLTYTSLDSSFVGHLLMLGLFFFGVGFGLWILRNITKVEEQNL